MNKSVKICLSIFLTVALVATSFYGYPKASAYSPPHTTLKVGLYYDTTALPSANLQTVTSLGGGFAFGFLDASRQFVSINAQTAETKITMLRDRNMYYDSSDNSYKAGTTGAIVVGCFHIQLDTAYSTYAEALAAVSIYTSGFVKYSSGTFYACIGNYISIEDANAAVSSNGLSSCSITSGTSSTVAVVKTGTNTILFEFEYGTANYLVVMPVAANGEKCQTWFKGYKYYGGFQYPRYGGDLTVINCVDVEDYTKGVIPYEMSNSWPLEALKAQAVCARTYVIANRGKHGNFDVCTTEDCQVYRGIGLANATTDAAVDQTIGKYLTYNGALCIAYYASSNGGASENSENVWKETVPYLRGVVDPFEADIATIAPSYSWTVTYTASEITARLRSKGYNCGTIVSMVVSQYTAVGNVYKVTLTDANGIKWSFTKGDSIRYVLGASSIHFAINGAAPGDVYVNDATGTISGGLQSSYAIGGSGLTELLGQNNIYAITGSGETLAVGAEGQTQTTSGVFVLKGTGRGHNIGMSQWGAYSMAKFHAMTYDQILKFYFTGTIVE